MPSVRMINDAHIGSRDTGSTRDSCDSHDTRGSHDTCDSRGSRDGRAQIAPFSNGRLILVPTPIGNLGDITLRALDALREADVIYAEDTRVTGKLLRALEIDRASALVSQIQRLDENTLAARTPEVLERIANGQSVAYCTDAGMPGISDPGLRLVAAARDAALPVEVLPGPSAAATAYVASGTSATSYFFGGFFPRKASERHQLLEHLRNLDAALVFYESPHRLASALQAIADAYPQREVAVCRELTKLHEEVARGTAQELAAKYADGAKGEVVIVIDAPSKDERKLQAGLAAEDAAGKAAAMVKDGATQKQIVAALAADGISKNDAYAIALTARVIPSEVRESTTLVIPSERSEPRNPAAAQQPSGTASPLQQDFSAQDATHPSVEMT